MNTSRPDDWADPVAMASDAPRTWLTSRASAACISPSAASKLPVGASAAPATGPRSPATTRRAMAPRATGSTTSASDRLVPVHPNLIECGWLHYVEQQRRDKKTKLFEEIDPGTKGIRAVAFSKWFTHFLRNCGASQSRTCFHSFRHNFRDELRAARIDHDLAIKPPGSQ